MKDNKIFPVVMRPWETPVPIPNTMVKTWAAEGTILVTVWENRILPDQTWLIKIQPEETQRTLKTEYWKLIYKKLIMADSHKKPR